MKLSLGGRQSGLTLVEVLIALVVLAVVLLPVMLGFTQALATTSESSISAAATSIVRDKVEELKRMDYSVLTSQPREARDLRPGDGFFEVAVTVEVRRPDDAAQAGLKEAVLSVYRTGSSDPVATVDTYFTPHGI
jgi:prepilin-type N-terminal cleavage/methylation domain-containing protein